jgi:hypothetical protein
VSLEHASGPDVTFGLFDWVDADGARARLTGMIQASGCNHVAGAFAFGSLTYPEARSSLTRFAGDVAPALRSVYGDTASDPDAVS